MATNTNTNQKKASYFNPFENMNQMPNFMDFGNLRQQFNKNMEAVTAANQVALDLSKEAARRAAEVMQKNTKCLMECAQDSMSSKNLDDARNRQAEMLSNVMENSFAQAKEAADICSKATREVLDVCNKRMSEALSEFSQK